MQLAVCEVDYCEFVGWTLQGIVVIRIRLYPDFFDVVKPKLDTFFVQCVLPNLMVHHIKESLTRSTDLELQESETSKGMTDNVFCYCREGEDK